jgi:hypothetical protein
MTTIFVYRDTVYADSRCSEEGTHYKTKKIFRVGEAIVACSGNNVYINAFLKQYAKDPDKLKAPRGVGHDGEDPEFAALVLNKDGLFVYDIEFGYDQIDGLHHAIGSGRKAVLGALEAMKLRPHGVDPILCVRAACEVDQYSAPPIQWMKLGEFKLHRET